MGYVLKRNLADKSNYGNVRDTAKIKWIVIHYTGNDGDKDENNGKYFRNNKNLGASAHYFVDSDSVTQSVPDNYIAWSVGGSKYSNCATTGGGKCYGKCTNANSISIELCDDVKNGTVYPSAATIANAIALAKTLMKKYNIPASKVIRHFDVTGKSCPSYWCGTTAKDGKWKTEFWDKLSSSASASAFKPYIVKITADELNVRADAGTNYKVTAVVKKNEAFTITGEKMNGSTKWLKLKSGKGYISSKYTKKV